MMMQKTDIWMPLYIGDYLADTSRLTTEQHGAYLLLLMDYWRSGRLPDNDQVLAQIAKLPLETWLIHRGILQGFFEASNGEWIHSRVEKELGDSQDRKLEQLKKSILGNYKRWGVIDQKVSENPILKQWWDELFPKLSHRDSPKDSPSFPSSSSSSPSSILINKLQAPDGVSLEVWNDFVEQRKKARAVISENVIKTIAKEAAKAGWSLEQALSECSARGWRGFKAEWVKDNKPAQKTQAERNSSVLQGLTRGLIGGGNDVNLLGK
jgi:hypothetical protein